MNGPLRFLLLSVLAVGWPIGVVAQEVIPLPPVCETSGFSPIDSPSPDLSPQDPPPPDSSANRQVSWEDESDQAGLNGCSPADASGGDPLGVPRRKLTTWTFDYRVETIFDGHTTREFGTSWGGYAPLSRLVWPLQSTWHGLRVGVERPKWRAHFQWLAPMIRGTYDEMADYDWSGPNREPALLSLSPTRWIDGQKLELEAAYQLRDRVGRLPLEIWPVVGFRFQRFDQMAHDGLQVLNDGSFHDPSIPPVGYRWHENMISFNQQYYLTYLGARFLTDWTVFDTRVVTIAFQIDVAAANGHNIDHHISGYEADNIHRFTREDTAGGALHVGLTAETPLVAWLVLGVEVDHTAIRTTGTHRWTTTGAETGDMWWTNGVKVGSDQSSVTTYLRARF